MFEQLIAFTVAFMFGLGVAFCLFGVIFAYEVFFGESMFENAIIPMVVSFSFISVGLSFLYLVLF